MMHSLQTYLETVHFGLDSGFGDKAIVQKEKCHLEA